MLEFPDLEEKSILTSKFSPKIKLITQESAKSNVLFFKIIIKLFFN